tara:strand:+ start:708 stop:863 length:156 start_codon:yes stop_codon:yes gene_type:complete
MIEKDFKLKQTGKKNKDQKNTKKTKGGNIYNSKHIRVSKQKTENSKKKNNK